MLRTMLLLTKPGKIHRATVILADLHHVGSVTADEDLLDAADLLPRERVDILDVDNSSVVTGDDPAEVVPGMAAGDLLARGDTPAAVVVAR